MVNDIEFDENKNKAEKPVFDINSLDTYPKQYEEYLSDNFSLKGHFLKYIGEFNLTVLNKSPKPNSVIIGDNKWLYMVYRELSYYLGKSKYTEKKLNIILEEFKYRKHILDSMGIDMVVVLNPTKYSVYPDYLPSSLKSNHIKNTSEQILEYFQENSDIKIIYPRNYLLAHKKEHQLYYKGDNHWNFIGGYYAAKEIIDHLDMDKKLPEFSLEDFIIDTTPDFKGNLAKMAVHADKFAENHYTLTLRNNNAKDFEPIVYTPTDGFKWDYQSGFNTGNDSLPNALIIRDSFGTALMPYMKNCFNQTTYIFDNWNYGFNREIIEQEKPDVVIYMALENLFSNVLKKGITKDKH